MATRSVVATDTFDASISASWTNGPGGFGNCQWVVGGLVSPSATNDDSIIGRNTGTYAGDHYGLIIATALTVTGALGVVTRWQGGTSSACYLGLQAGDNKDYYIFEVDAGFGFTELASTGTGALIATPTYIAMEAEGTALRLYKDTTDGTTLVLSTTDGTLTGGTPGAHCYGFGATTDAIFTSWEGGDMVTAGGDPVRGLSRGKLIRGGMLSQGLR